MTTEQANLLNTNDIVGIRKLFVPMPIELARNGRATVMEVWKRARVVGLEGGALLVRYDDGGKQVVRVEDVLVEADVTAWEADG